MTLTVREFWTVFHGMLAGAIFLLAFSAGLVGLLNLKRNSVSPEGLRERLARLTAQLWVMALIAWVTVLSGTYIVFPWYRFPSEDSPRSVLLDNPTKAGWESFGMVWKEHVAWIAPILATAVAWLVARYGSQLAQRHEVRRAAIVLFCLAFVAAAIAGLFGTFINKAAPIY